MEEGGNEAGVQNLFITLDSGKVPMKGFFSDGEYGRASGGHTEFHNMTSSLVALKEK